MNKTIFDLFVPESRILTNILVMQTSPASAIAPERTRERARVSQTESE